MASYNKEEASMEGVTLVKVQERTYRVSSSSLAPMNLAKEPPVNDTDSVDTSSTIYTEEIITLYHPLHRSYHGLLIGKGGSTLKRLKIETGTRIDVMNGKDSVMIKGTKEKVDHAVQVIDQFVQQAFERARPTHFLSFPIASSYATRKLDDFHKAITSSTFYSAGFESDMLIPIVKLHITLGVLKLLSPSDIEKTVAFLKTELFDITSDFMSQEKVLSIRLKGLAVMQDNPRRAHVLYIEAQDETKNKILDQLCDKLRERMIDAGYMQNEDRPFKMHITLIKSKPKKTEDGLEVRPTFDAQPILKAYKELDLGVVHLDKLHLMKMAGVAPDGSYISEGSISVG